VKRLRLLAAMLGCLAGVWASAFPAMAFASVFHADAHAGQTIAHAPCHGCPDCDDTPCAPGVLACTIACLGNPPMLAAVTLVTPTIETVKIVWPAFEAFAQGRTPPPEPLPPRL